MIEIFNLTSSFLHLLVITLWKPVALNGPANYLIVT